MLNIEVIENENQGHDDIIVSIEGLINELTLDSYWLIVGSNCQTFQDVKDCVANLLTSWENEILNNTGNTTPVYLALDISDEYIGCIRVITSGEFLHLTYGSTQERNMEGGSLNLITDFSPDGNTLLVNRSEFLKILNSEINRLKNIS